MSEGYNCPNCGAPIGFTEKCEYCGTRIEWRPYVINLAPQLYYHKTHEASAVGTFPRDMAKHASAREAIKASLGERIGDQIANYLVVVEKEYNGPFPYTEFRADIVWADKNERIGKNE